MLKKPYVYLCSRVAKDAQELNNKVAASLRKRGFEVYVPHEEDANNPPDGQFDAAAVYAADYRAMMRADLCVVVGRFGRDCAFEIGWFEGRNVPIYYVTGGSDDYKSSPMVIPSLINQVIDPDEAGEYVYKNYTR